MKLREWATPLTIGVFVLMAVTGLLMFFHADQGFNKLAHKWIGLVMVSAVGLHVVVNLSMLKRHFANRNALAIMGLCATLLGASFVTLPGSGQKPPQFIASQALLDAPIALVAQVASKDPQTLVDALNAAGINARPDGTLRQAAGAKQDDQMKALGIAFHK